MTAYWLGLLTLPAITGAAALLYGLWKAGAWLLDHSPIVRMGHRPKPAEVAILAGALVSTPSLWAVNISRYVCIVVGVGHADRDRASKVRNAVLAELKPPVRLTPTRRPDTTEETDHA